MSTAADQAHLMSDEDFEALEEMLTSDMVPEDCMDLEMLDGFLAGVLASPVPIATANWLPAVWSAHADEISFGSGSGAQRAIRLVLSYYNELVTTIGDEEEGWEPFCFAIAEGDSLKLAEEWMAGFAQGLELWPQDWEKTLPAAEAEALRAELDAILAPWGADEAAAAGDEERLRWLEEAGERVSDIVAHWRELELAMPTPVAVELPSQPKPAGPGRNEPCPCGSGKKYKKCHGADA
ncbi:hypothetical protein dqs_1647 [Azoarcus olearius]|uniref:UPF0149 family protein n=1 Tax=Azoarcus sp. (strain BH72) TaxID=418699 RepID=UPI00080643B9|nr:UPF0149 family protein [Azoarcus olearius]ANQ84691.1 hypothetical protein dqs_1647 [Azoarcus olearius]